MGDRCKIYFRHEWAGFDGIGEDRKGIRDGGQVLTLQKWEMGAFAEMRTPAGVGGVQGRGCLPGFLLCSHIWEGKL